MKNLFAIVLSLFVYVAPVNADLDESQPELVAAMYGDSSIGRVQLGFYDDGSVVGRRWIYQEPWQRGSWYIMPNGGVFAVFGSFVMYGTVDRTPGAYTYTGVWTCGNSWGTFRLGGC